MYVIVLWTNQLRLTKLLRRDVREFVRRVCKFIPGTSMTELNQFFASKYTAILLPNDGVIGYTAEQDYVFWWYLYDGNRLGNRLRAVKIANELTLPIMYTGVNNKWINNSLKHDTNLYQFIPKRKDD